MARLRSPVHRSDQAGGRGQQVLRQGGGAPPQPVGDRVRPRLGPARGRRGVPGDGMRPGGIGPERLGVRRRERTDLAAARPVQRPRVQSDTLCRFPPQ